MRAVALVGDDEVERLDGDGRVVDDRAAARVTSGGASLEERALLGLRVELGSPLSIE